ncbi:acetolactate synthase large subunit [Natranaerovirga pectinivora]|uniref:Acetolactate synthase n=1 Tax=Natranaerovirga pectinivora TaxID=682400 RepID=A0A4R3MNM9_9FIRM|nr:biosynthetic-type acetolactate synthase large subunit [Natranaerovirga pectinivora]TCT16112.1 acetolactate synthase large subunit [Natranaerovirga pectinivora]
MKMIGAEITIKLLENCGVNTIIGMPGGANLPLYNALYKSNINHILARHEQGAAFIAQGISRVTGKAAVCFATSGPGATNLITALADAKLDSIPLVAITGQVPYNLIGTDAFQEVDTYGLSIPVTKHNFLIRSIEELFEVIPLAFEIAETGRPGPVLVDIPKNIQNELFEFQEFPKNHLDKKKEEYYFPSDTIKEAADLIDKATRPVLYMGGGIIHSDAHKEVLEFVRKGSIPTASTLMGLGVIPTNEPLYLGMLGMHGARYTNLVLHESDLVLAFGVRFDDRAVGNITKFCPNAKIIHIDIDQSEINKIRKADVSIIGNLKDVLPELTKAITKKTREDWLEQVEEIKKRHPFVLPKEKEHLHPLNIIQYIGKILHEDAIITTDVGQHQMWAAQVFPFKKPRTFLTSGGLGTMGFGLPAAIGAALAKQDNQVICFSGDGSILINIQELATLADLNLNVKIFILNNGHLGLVRQQQQMFFEENYMAAKFATNPDYALIAKGFGINSCNLSKEEDPIKALEKVINSSGPWLVDIPIKSDENVLPIVPVGKGNTEMVGGEADE